MWRIPGAVGAQNNLLAHGILPSARLFSKDFALSVRGESIVLADGSATHYLVVSSGVRVIKWVPRLIQCGSL
jgi:hypothetical protein